MKRLFNKVFFKFMFGFLAVILVSIVVIIMVSDLLESNSGYNKNPVESELLIAD